MKNFRNWLHNIKSNRFILIGLFVMLGIVLYGSMYDNVSPEKLDLKPFSIAKNDILSPITIEDIEATEEKKQEAALEVEDQYVLKTEYAVNRVEIISAIFDAVNEVNMLESEANKLEDSEEESPENRTEEHVQTQLTETGTMTIDKRINQLREMIPTELQDLLSRNVLETLIISSPQQLDSAKTTTITAVKQIMQQPIKVGEEDQKKQQAYEELKNVNLPQNLRNAMVQLAQYAIIPNYVYDMKGTEVLRQQAMDEVNPVKILAGQVLVREGQVIDRDTFKQLELVGLLKEEVNYYIFIGLVIFVSVLIAIIAYFFKEFDLQTSNQSIAFPIYVLVFTFTILLMKGISLFPIVSEIGYIFPIAMATMLIRILVNERIALISSVMLAICGSIIFNGDIIGKFDFSIGVYFLLSGIGGTIFLNKQHHRSNILKAGLYVSLLNIIVITAIFMMRNGNYTNIEIGTYLSFAFLSGFISAVLTLGLMPVFETGFGMLSTMKLIELSNPNHPLLRKILMETPGTYHHSVMVANLSEAACEAIGANGLLARVGAYYHDIGKTKRPQFYIENQMNIENPHNNISPQLSKTIITAHPYDGAEMLRQHKIPKEIVDIAEQHHGTTLLKYFYYQAKEQADSDVLESDFRYPGPKASSKESAIVGIADSVEAAVRSMKNPTPQKIENLVRSIVTERLQDGQFDECDITIKELNCAAKSMCETLNGIFHSRIEYPEIAKPKREVAEKALVK
ncbi:HD family phosphohydrolase [Calidifontibacillus oryziterrae]|uniref:HD family phosphohydrolase n=1 Tax=Calidifontibacillus oryziterrae TaxID=1191699 RepID=UPI00030025E2|nr:HD family phosphohydrolase [Calidifontibacillus oryziterrae]